MNNLARLLFLLGAALILAGGAVYLLGRLNLPLGRLPGDIRIQRENFTCLFPLGTMILLSIGLTVVVNIVLRLLNRK